MADGKSINLEIKFTISLRKPDMLYDFSSTISSYFSQIFENLKLNIADH
jgi:hypothetical protein